MRTVERNKKKTDKGFAMVVVLLMLTVLSSLLAAYVTTARIELATLKASKDSTTGFFSAEGGLNIRAETIRTTFVGYNTPTGTSPSSTNPCEGGNLGSGSFACQTFDVNGRDVVTYVVDHQNGGDPAMIKIPQGELYQNLNAQEYKYTASSQSIGLDGQIEAILQLRFKSRLVPLFQFAAFYNKDLEILPGPNMTLSGPVHTNGNLYLNSNGTLSLNGQVTTAGSMYRGRKDGDNSPVCRSNSVQAMDPSAYRQLVPSCTVRTLVTSSHTAPFNGMLKFNVQDVTVPEPEVLDPQPGKLYWDKADLRLVLRLNSSNNPDTTNVSTGIEVRDSSDAVNVAATTTLKACSGTIKRNPTGGDSTTGAVGTSYSFRNNREAKNIRMLDVDLQALLDCLHTSSWFSTGKTLGDTSEGGLVFYFTVKGPNSSDAANSYGIRVRNGAEIKSIVSGAPSVKGLTIVTDQAAYLLGNFNSTNKKPAALLGDSFNVLSNAWWSGTDFRDSYSQSPKRLDERVPNATTQNVAVLSGTDTTGGSEGTAGEGGAYNGGLENYPRFHEHWNGSVTYTYRGSLVSLNKPRHVNGVWRYGSGSSVPSSNTATYTAPQRNWDYDTSFNNAANLPPITPRFVYLKQELFVRDYDQDS